jgi:hypothetical protein
MHVPGALVPLPLGALAVMSFRFQGHGLERSDLLVGIEDDAISSARKVSLRLRLVWLQAETRWFSYS